MKPSESPVALPWDTVSQAESLATDAMSLLAGALQNREEPPDARLFPAARVALAKALLALFPPPRRVADPIGRTRHAVLRSIIENGGAIQ